MLMECEDTKKWLLLLLSDIFNNAYFVDETACYTCIAIFNLLANTSTFTSMYNGPSLIFVG